MAPMARRGHGRPPYWGKEEDMLSETLEKELGQYEIGAKVRELRLNRNMRLVELAAHTSLSPALLSKIERGKLIPTLPTLMRIALVFSVGLEYFFSDDRKKHTFAVVRKGERKRFPEKLDGKDSAYNFESLDFAALERRLNAFWAEWQPIEPSQAEAHTHAGVEFIYVIEGKLGLTYRSSETVLEAGDTVYFDATVAHSYRRVGTKPCNGLVVTVT